MYISQLYHFISEVEKESRRRANEKFKGEFRRLEREKSKLAGQLMDLMSASMKSNGEILIDGAEFRIGNLIRANDELRNREHETAKKVGEEAERVAQMLLKKKGIEISVKDSRKEFFPNSVVECEYDYTQANDDDLELQEIAKPSSEDSYYWDSKVAKVSQQ